MNTSIKPITINRIPPIRSACCPNQLVPIRTPSRTPRTIEINEKTPIISAVEYGSTPVTPALKPIDRQLKARMKPRKNDSFQLMKPILRVRSPEGFADFPTTHKPSPISKLPPIMLEADLERKSDKKLPAKMETNAQTVEISEIIKL